MKPPENKRRRATLVWLLGATLAFAAAASWRARSATDPPLVLYRNQRWNFCVPIPAAWTKSEALDGTGVDLTEGPASWKAPTRISIGAFPNQPSEADESRNQTLEENYTAALNALKQYGEAEDLIVLSKRYVPLQGCRGILSRLSYTNRQTGESRVTEEFRFIKRQVVFFVDLTCRPKDFARLQPLFDRIVRSFRTGRPDQSADSHASE